MREQDKQIERYMELCFRCRHAPNRETVLAREGGWSWLTGNLGSEAGLSMDGGDEEIEEGEEWKVVLGFGEGEPLEPGNSVSVPVYLIARAFARRALGFVDSLPELSRLNSTVVDFVSNAMIAPAKIAGGTSIGDEIDELGGNIACCKRGLAAANLAIAALAEMKKRHVAQGEAYRTLMVEAVEVRNAIALHVVDLREKFRQNY